MAIIISEDGAPAEKVEDSEFGLESNLQKLIHDNPNTVPLYEIDDDTQLFIAAREFPTNSGPIDALGFDAKGNIYVIETKLQKNPDKRYVVAQALDYGASLWRHSTDFEAFISRLDEKTMNAFGEKFEEKFLSFFGDTADPDFLTKIQSNLSDGVIKFVVLMDTLHDNLKDLVLYVNQNSKFDLYAVELKYYKHKTFEILIPKLYGAEVKKEVVSTHSKSNSSHSVQTNEEEFWLFAENHMKNGEINTAAFDAIKTLTKLYTELTVKSGGRNTYWHVTTNFRDIVKLVVNDSNDKVVMYLDSDSSIGVYPDKVGPIADFAQALLIKMIEAGILKRNEKHLRGTQWFTSLKINYANDIEIEKFVKINQDVFQDAVSRIPLEEV
jgi:hypothetical protein